MSPSTKALRYSIKQLAAEGARLSAAIRDTAGQERDRNWNEKRAIGRKTRRALLAYAWLRGRSYASTERHCRDGNRPRAYWLRQALEDVAPQATALFEPAEVEAWLAGGALRPTEERPRASVALPGAAL